MATETKLEQQGLCQEKRCQLTLSPKSGSTEIGTGIQLASSFSFSVFSSGPACGRDGDIYIQGESSSPSSTSPSADLSRGVTHRRFQSRQLDNEGEPSPESSSFKPQSSGIDEVMCVLPDSDQGFLFLTNLGSTSVRCSLVVHHPYWKEVATPCGFAQYS